MSDESGKKLLLQTLAETDARLWTILQELALLDESKRREILRPHNELGLSREQDADLLQLGKPLDEALEQRARLDKAFDFLTLLEIAYQTAVVTEAEQPIPQREHLCTLFQSGAVLRYVNFYLYFGIRFLADRLDPTSLLAPASTSPLSDEVRARRSFPLRTPPTFPAGSGTDGTFGKFISSTLPPPPGSEAEAALSFLDGFFRGSDEPQRYELWLRGLLPGLDEEWTARFTAVRQGLIDWVCTRSEFYLSLQPSGSLPTPATALSARPGQPVNDRPLGGWMVVNPVVARIALADVYWIGRLLRAEVTAGAAVTYPRTAWTSLLRFEAALAHETKLANDLRKAEEVLRSVFDFVCDLAENAVTLSLDEQRTTFEPDQYPPRPPQVAGTRVVLDEELEQIMRQRKRRSFRDAEVSPRGTGNDNGAISGSPAIPSADGWSERLKSGRKPQNLVGLAFSGGGIRSATFNLGVLQGLQAFDQLRYVDYLSTVSGGGFIGSWLVGNVKRTQQWLGRLTCWDESIAHLRAYSNYLAPRSGLFSADPWTIAASWARNALLIQLTGLSWLLLLLLAVLLMRFSFVTLFGPASTHLSVRLLSQVFAALMGCLVLKTLVDNFRSGVVSGKGALDDTKVRLYAVLPAWIGAFFVTGQMWSNATQDPWSCMFPSATTTYSAILRSAWQPWLLLLLFYLLALFWTLSVSLLKTSTGSQPPPPGKRKRMLILGAFGISFLCLVALYLGLSAVFYLFLFWRHQPDRFGSYAFVFGPALVIAAFTLSITFLIGLSGRVSNEPQREWWTRFGTWVTIFAGIGLLLSGIAVFGPRLFLAIHAMADKGLEGTFKWGTLATWLGTVVTGLFSGKSSKTAGDKVKSPLLEFLAKLGGFVFIVGAVLGASTILYLLLLNLGTSYGLNTLYWQVLKAISPRTLIFTFLALGFLAWLFSLCFEINIFGLNQFYRNRLVRCYLGASRWAFGERSPHPFTKFDFADDLPLSDLSTSFRGPFPIFNCSLNLAGSADLALHTRHSASFSLTPLRCGADRPKVGYAPTGVGPDDSFAHGVRVGQAVAISGAAASPNMGYNTSPLVAFLLTMFNVRLGWWFPNPGQRAWNKGRLGFSLYYLVNELFGMAGENRRYLSVSDGGHFENLGIYELVRRRCKVIIACDAECDELLQFGGLGNAIRLCKTDFNATIDIDVKSIRSQKDNASLAHCTVGKITYANGSIGYLLYIKASITGDEDVSVAQYRSSHPTFPHETTADQFFSEDQFESYRRLGHHIVCQAFRAHQPGVHPVLIVEDLANVLAPAGCHPETFLKHTRVLDTLLERLRNAPSLAPFFRELTATAPPNDAVPTAEEFAITLELLQLMEDVFMDLRLDDLWDHPDNRGWAMLFMQWARSPRFRHVWSASNRTFGIRFEYFCDARLGLTRDNPIVRV